MKHGMHVKNMKVQDSIPALPREDLMDKRKDGMVMMMSWRILLVMMGIRSRRTLLAVERDGLKMNRRRRGTGWGGVLVVEGHKGVEEVCLMRKFKISRV